MNVVLFAILMTAPLFTWKANPGPQQRFLACGAYEALYGGAAGGGKSESLLVDPMRYVGNASFRALLLRRTYPELERSLIDRSRQLYPAVAPGASYNSQDKCWRFPSGAKIYFGHAEHEHSVHQYQGAEFSYIGFDELTHFLEKQYTYLLSRARSSAGMPVYIRSATNPGGSGHEWVMRRWARWLDPESPARVPAGQARWYVNAEDGEKWVERGTPESLSRVFIPAKVEDNPHLSENDPGYRQRLMGLDRVTRAQLLEGNWLVKPAAGAYFQRSWVTFVDAAPARVAARFRAWDLAATAPGEGSDPDWTVGAKMSRTLEGEFVIEDVVRQRLSPGKVEGMIKSTAEIDGQDVSIDLPQDPGQAGKSQAAALIKMLAGFDVHAKTVNGDKTTRFKPFSAQAEAGNVRIVKGAWNQALIEELEAFPDGSHDDIVDAVSSAFNCMIGHSSPSFSGPKSSGRRV